MPTPERRRIVLAARPVGEPKPEDFRLETVPMPSPAAGEVLARAVWLSLDPYMRGRMSAAKSYAPPVELGEVMTGETVSEVLESRHPAFQPGDLVAGPFGWQSHGVLPGDRLRPIAPAPAPIQSALGVLGMPGLTAHVGLIDIGRPRPGETVVVSAATGAVGSIVGQIARIKGCRVVGVAGTPEKCAYAVETLGYHACVSHRSPTFAADLAAACPAGIDIYFENVGGKVLEAVLPLMNRHGRIPVCGTIAAYNLTELPPGPDRTPLLLRAILVNRLLVQGFIVFDHDHRRAEAIGDLAGWLRDGKLIYREQVVAGLEAAPAAFLALLRGDHLGKMLVRVGADPTALP